MSITFWAPDAPTQRVQPYEDEPDYFEDRSVLPEVQFSGTNGWAMQRLMGLEPDECGRLEPHQFDSVIERLTRLVNGKDERKAGLLDATYEEPKRRFVRDGEVLRMTQGPAVYHGGRTDEYLMRRSSQLLELFVAARKEGFAVSWG